MKRALHAAIALWLAGLLAACDKTEEQAKVPGDEKAVSVVPEHFDPVRAEQFEKEEDSLTQRVRSN